MSMKSFDKFCDAILESDIDREKEIFDERQKQMQLHIAIQTFGIFAALMFVHSFVSDLFKWTESNFAPLCLYGIICLFCYLIRTGVKGCFVPVNGSASGYRFAGACVFLGLVTGIREIVEMSENSWVIIKGNAVTDHFSMLLTLALVVAMGVTAVIFTAKSDKEEKK